MELHPEELQLSADEDESDGGHDDHDKGLKIRRTVTQVRSPVEPFEELGLRRDTKASYMLQCLIG